jgi:hypothetical protein
MVQPSPNHLVLLASRLRCAHYESQSALECLHQQRQSILTLLASWQIGSSVCALILLPISQLAAWHLVIDYNHSSLLRAANWLVFVIAPSHRAWRHITDPDTVNLAADSTLIEIIAIVCGIEVTLDTLCVESVKVVTTAQFYHVARIFANQQLSLHLRYLLCRSVIKLVEEFWHADAARILFVSFRVLLSHYMHFEFEGTNDAPLSKLA